MDTSPATPGARLPRLDLFPYLTTRIVPALYHVSLLPAGIPDTDLIERARTQVLANRLPLCLALLHDSAFYFEPDGDVSTLSHAPLGGNLVTGKLAPAVAYDDEVEEFRARQVRLAAVIEQTSRRGGFLPGSLCKGSHAASDEERHRLDGYLSDGTPRGLTQCVTCDDWKGACLDPSPRFAGRVMTVHCACENFNRCARCLAPLFSRRLNANFYDPRNRIIFHVPGFCGLGHRCAEQGSTVITLSGDCLASSDARPLRRV